MNAVVPAAGQPSEALRRLVLDSVSSPHSRRPYGFALDEFFAWYGREPRRPFSKAVVQEYRVHLEEQGCTPARKTPKSAEFAPSCAAITAWNATAER